MAIYKTPVDHKLIASPEFYKDREVVNHLEDPLHKERLERLLFHLKLVHSDGDTICDLGAGCGAFLSFLPDKARLSGYDLQPANITYAKVHYGINLKLKDITKIDLPYEDIMVLGEVLEHLEDPKALLAKLKGKCQFVIASVPANETLDSFYPYHLWIWTENDFALMFEELGYKIAMFEKKGISQFLIAKS